MSDINGTNGKSGGGFGGFSVHDVPKAKTLKTIAKAIDEDWPITPEIRDTVIKQAALVITEGRGRMCDQVGAMKVLIAADNANIRRKMAKTEERKADTDEALQALRMAMQSQQFRELMAQSAKAMCTEQGPQDEIDV